MAFFIVVVIVAVLAMLWIQILPVIQSCMDPFSPFYLYEASSLLLLICPIFNQNNDWLLNLVCKKMHVLPQEISFFYCCVWHMTKGSWCFYHLCHLCGASGIFPCPITNCNDDWLLCLVHHKMLALPNDCQPFSIFLHFITTKIIIIDCKYMQQWW